jgi:hypothetical protein
MVQKSYFLRLNIIEVNGLKILFSKFSSFWITFFMARVSFELKKYWPNFVQNFYTVVFHSLLNDDSSKQFFFNFRLFVAEL